MYRNKSTTKTPNINKNTKTEHFDFKYQQRSQPSLLNKKEVEVKLKWMQ